jgi:hypothetical protein
MPEPARTTNLVGDYFGFDTTGDLSQWKYIATYQETNGEYLEMEEVQSDKCGNGFDSICSPPLHIHLTQVEELCP